MSGARTARVCVSVSSNTHEKLRAIAAEEGRSLSNLCAHLLEQALEERIGAR
ncbi:hypothetical protein [Synechococcus sp. A10-1-5-1]|uniref:ribbon-helix-helix domain-containing protein n=1 Tax=Synechococcus sp. A10-1-5-1 TaxID=2936507 RepID=UPI0035303F64